VTLRDLEPIEEPEETGLTFEDNARLKALYYSAHAGMTTVAEDSGLVIDGLDGEPGVRSARFLHADATYPERFAAIFGRLAGPPEKNRAARFVCALAVADAGHIIYEARGTVEGEIAREARGSAGFGYDPIFYYPPYRSTLAEVTEGREAGGRSPRPGVSFAGIVARLTSHLALDLHVSFWNVQLGQKVIAVQGSGLGKKL
jgi:XTP/dITP diphosphohydrolase